MGAYPASYLFHSCATDRIHQRYIMYVNTCPGGLEGIMEVCPRGWNKIEACINNEIAQCVCVYVCVYVFVCVCECVCVCVCFHSPTIMGGIFQTLE